MSKNQPLDFARLVEWPDGELSVEESQQVVGALRLASDGIRADAANFRAGSRLATPGTSHLYGFWQSALIALPKVANLVLFQFLV